MDEDDCVQAFTALADVKQAQVLARCAHGLTIEVRAALFDKEDEWAERAWDLNEFLHRIVGQISPRFTGSSKRYPDVHVARWLAELAARRGGSIAGTPLADILASVREE